MFKKLLLRNLTLSFVIAISFASCSVQLVPHKDPAMLVTVQEISNNVNILYERIIASADKTYTTYESDYHLIDQQIDSVVTIDSTRLKAADILKQALYLQTFFTRYEADHKARGKLNNGELKLYELYMRSIIRPLLISENSLK